MWYSIIDIAQFHKLLLKNLIYHSVLPNLRLPNLEYLGWLPNNGQLAFKREKSFYLISYFTFLLFCICKFSLYMYVCGTGEDHLEGLCVVQNLK